MTWTWRGFVVSAAASMLVAGLLGVSQAHAQTFYPTGAEQTYAVPARATAVHVVAVGANGCCAVFGGFPPPAPVPAGLGMSISADLPIPSGLQTLYVEVGQSGSEGAAGFNGGGIGGTGSDQRPDASGGGGASDIRTCSRLDDACVIAGGTLGSRLIVAGGGGGGNADGNHGGDAGYPNGADGKGVGGKGGTANAGGAGTTGGCSTSTAGTAGSLATGGNGGNGVSYEIDQNSPLIEAIGGGGGGGYYGGGGGGGTTTANAPTCDGGGGGGSSYVTSSALNVSANLDVSMSPQVSITAPIPASTGTPPTISGGLTVGETLSEGHGGWTNDPTGYLYEWLRCDPAGDIGSCAPVAGATASSYAITPADAGSTLRVSETAATLYGPGQPSVSPPTGLVGAVPAAQLPPSIAGIATQGQTLAELHGSWTGAPTAYALQWQRCNAEGFACQPIAQATSSAYSLTAHEVGSTIRVVETATNAYGTSAASMSQPTALVNPLSSPTAAIVGSASALVRVPATFLASVIDSVSEPAAFAWTIGGRSVGSHPRLTYDFLAPGSYLVLLQVTDGAGETMTSQLRVTVTFRRLSIATYWRETDARAHLSLTVLYAASVPIGTRVQLMCSGRGCFSGRETLVMSRTTTCKRGTCKTAPAAGTGDIDLTRFVHDRQLLYGDTLSIVYTLRSYIGELTTFRMTQAGAQQHTTCLAPGSTKPGRGC